MTFPHMIDGVPHVLCQGCEALVPITQQQEDSGLPDRGLILRLQGWYGAFDDNALDDEPDELLLCHDCAERVYNAVPALAKRRGLHPNDERCCNYWWTFEGEQVIHGDGTSIPLVNGVLTQEAMDNFRREQDEQRFIELTTTCRCGANDLPCSIHEQG